MIQIPARLRAWLATVILLTLDSSSGPRLCAQDTAVAAEYVERLQRLEGQVADLLESRAVLMRRQDRLADDLAAVREELARAGARQVSTDDHNRLAATVRDLDRKREEDKQLILGEIKKLAQTPVVLPTPRESPRPEPPKPAASEVKPDVPAKGYKYQVKAGDTLSAIVQAYRQSGVLVTVDDVLKANPNLKPTRMREGQEIFIPDSALK
jgi:LysM repeat protein